MHSVNLYVQGLQKQSVKYLEGPGKVLEFRVSNIVGTLAAICDFVVPPVASYTVLLMLSPKPYMVY